MAYAAIAYTIPQYEDRENWWMKAYTQGTTTPVLMALDAAGVTTVAKLELNDDGFPKTVGNALVIPYIDGAYDLWLFPTEADANANDTTNAIQLADNIDASGQGAGNVTATNISSYTNYEFLTVSDAQNGVLPDGTTITIKEKDIIRIKDRANGIFDTVLTSTVTPNGFDIIVSIADPNYSFALRVGVELFAPQFGAKGDGASNDTLAIRACAESKPASTGVAKVFLGDGVFIVDYVALRGIDIVGNGWTATTIKASATPNTRLVSNRLNLDGVTANTEGNGGVKDLTIDCNNENTVGLDLYGGFCRANNVKVINSSASTAIFIVYVLMTNVQQLYAFNNASDGITITIDSPLHDGDVTTSLDMTTFWSQNNGGWGVRIQNTNYSVVRSGTTQNNTLGGVFVEGGKFGLSVSTGLTFIGTASEEDGGNPYYFKDIRNLTVINPFITGVSGNSWDNIVLDNCTGTIIDYSTQVTPAAGFYDLAIINAPTLGAITSIGGDFSIDSTELVSLSSSSSIINNTLMNSVAERTLLNASKTQQTTESIEDVDGFTGQVLKADDGTRLAAFRRTGTPIFGTNGAISSPSTNLNNGEVSFYVDTGASNITFVIKDGSGTVKTGTLAVV